MIRNLRDLAIYKNSDGKRLRKGEFLRSAALINLADADVDWLKSFESLDVIDLRTNKELAENQDCKVGNYHHISILAEETLGISHEEESDEELPKQIPDMCKLYKEMITSAHSIDAFRKIFSIIFDKNRESTILWHCTEGKDRCGLTSALFLKALDYDDETIIRDYLKSLKSARKRAYKFFLLITIFKRNFKAAVAVKNVFLVKREYLQAAFDAIIDNYGSFEAFFERIGVTKDVRSDMKLKYLE